MDDESFGLVISFGISPRKNNKPYFVAFNPFASHLKGVLVIVLFGSRGHCPL